MHWIGYVGVGMLLLLGVGIVWDRWSAHARRRRRRRMDSTRGYADARRRATARRKVPRRSESGSSGVDASWGWDQGGSFGGHHGGGHHDGGWDSGGGWGSGDSGGGDSGGGGD